METKSVEKLGISDGTYSGLWGGYVVEILDEPEYDGFHFSTKDGVRGINIPVVVEIKDGYATIKVVGEK